MTKPKPRVSKKEQARVTQQKTALLAALSNSLGVVTAACEKCGVSRKTHYNYLRDDPEYREAVEELTNLAVDYGESALFRRIEAGDTTAIIFFLKCRGKSRGYIERQEIDHTTNGESLHAPIVKRLASLSDEELERLALGATNDD